MNFKLQEDFRKINSNGQVSQYLNKFNGEWFNIQNDYESIIPFLKEGFKVDSIEEFEPQFQDVVFSLIENGLIREEGISTPPRPVSDSRNQVTLVIVESMSFCNLACTYCFEDVPTKGFRMSFTTAESIVRSIEQLNLAPSFTVEFNGGESFSNLPILEYIISEINKSQKLRTYNVRYGVTTNATFMNAEIIDFLKRNWVGVTVSLDGTQEDHDKYRIFKSGKGSFEKVMETLQEFNREGIVYNTISVISSADQLYRTYNFMKENGIKRISLVIRRHSDRLALDIKEYEELALAHYTVFKDSLNCFRNNVFAPLVLDYAVLIKNILRPHDPDYMCLRTPCGAGKNMVTYDTKGDIYACQDLIKESTFKICSSTDSNPQEIIDNNEIVKKLNARKPGGNRGCEECDWQNFCQGGCYSTSYFESKDLEKSFTTRTPHCEYYYQSFSHLMKDFLDDSRLLLQYAYLKKDIGA